MVRAIFLHTRDLRLADNRALQQCVQHSDSVVPIFILNPQQTDPDRNPYFSSAGFGFMLGSLAELMEDYSREGGTLTVVEGSLQLLADYSADYNLYISKDYTPFARQRITELQQMGFEVIEVDNHLTFPDTELMNRAGRYYQVYTPFWNQYRSRARPQLVRLSKGSWATIPGLDGISATQLRSRAEQHPAGIEAGRRAGLQLLNQVSHRQYEQERNCAALPTSRLSCHLKFGTISMREAYLQSPDDTFRSQLAWHDFYTLLAHGLGSDRTFGWGNYRNIQIQWPEDDRAEQLFERWQLGQTGYPIIDAGMRQLSSEHWQHNRLRLLCSNFLVFGLGLDWRWGEWWYATQLVDYDPCINNGNWQWSAGVGVDRPRQWPRTYNLYKQAQTIDPDGEYQRRYLPELRTMSTAAIQERNQCGHPDQIVNYDQNKETVSQLYHR